MIGPIRLPDREPGRGDRVSILLPAESIAALDLLARHHRRDRRAEVLALLVGAIEREDRLRRIATAPASDDSVPRSALARQRAAAVIDRKAETRGRAPR